MLCVKLSAFRRREAELRFRDVAKQALALRRFSGIEMMKEAFHLDEVVLKGATEGTRRKRLKGKTVLKELKKVYGRALNAND